MECVLYGVGSPFVEEVRETLRRLGWAVSGGVRNVETEFQPEGLEPIVGERAVRGVSLAVAFGLVTVVQMIVAELIPKGLAIARPDRTSRLLAPFIAVYGTVFGPVVGAFVIIAMQQYLAGFGQWVTVIQGVIFVVCVLTFRRGVIGEIAHYFRRSL